MITFKHGSIELVEFGDEYRIDSRVVAAGLDLQHESFMRAISKYQVQLEMFGDLRYEIGKPQSPLGGRPTKFCWLNADQAHLIAALSQNNERTVAYKVLLVQAFNEARTQLLAYQQPAAASAFGGTPAAVKGERYWHGLILAYSNYSSLKFRSEAIFDNFLASEDNARSRRTDLIRVVPRCVQVFELKVHQISEVDVSRTIATKGYLALVAAKYPNRPIDFRFTSPYGISDAGDRMLDIIGCRDAYRDLVIDHLNIRCRISFESVQVLAARIRADICKCTPENHVWQIAKYVDRGFEDLLNPPSLEASSNVIPFDRAA